MASNTPIDIRAASKETPTTINGISSGNTESIYEVCQSGNPLTYGNPAAIMHLTVKKWKKAANSGNIVDRDQIELTSDTTNRSGESQ